MLFVHDQALREYGGLQGVRDENLSHSARARPVNKLAYADRDVVDLCDLAAAYAYGLASNHPFNDGNKRTAWSCCVLFLEINGFELAAPAPDAIERVVRLAAGLVGEAEFAAWLPQSRKI